MVYSPSHFWQDFQFHEPSEDGPPPITWQGAALMAIDLHGHVLIIKRSDFVPSHRGQLALPGGHRLADENPTQTALREMKEETGIIPHHLNILGTLPPVATARKLSLIAVVARYQGLWANSILAPNSEWSFAFSIPLYDLFKEDLWVVGEKKGPSGDFPFYFRPLATDEITPCAGHLPKKTFPHPLMLWGATAQIFQLLKDHCQGL